MIAVTNDEFNAITEGRKVLAAKVSDSMFAAWFTSTHQAAIDSGEAALKNALDRHNGWDIKWTNAAPSDRAAIEAQCAAAESNMKRIKL